MPNPREHKRRIIVINEVEEGHSAPHGGSWKVAYADFVTALMALFLLLWLLMALKPQQKESMAQFFNNPENTAKAKTVSQGTPVMTEGAKSSNKVVLVSSRQVNRFISERLKELVTQDSKLENAMGVIPDEKGSLVKVDSAVIFPTGSAALGPEAKAVLNVVGEILWQHPLIVRISGHTDDAEATDSVYPSGWELSAARAAAALDYLSEHYGISPYRMEASGFADTRPLVPGNTPESKAKNRRLEFYFTGPEDSPPQG